MGVLISESDSVELDTHPTIELHRCKRQVQIIMYRYLSWPSRLSFGIHGYVAHGVHAVNTNGVGQDTHF